MLTIMVGGTKSFDEETNEFVLVGATKLQLEHSLVALSKWESIYEKPFLSVDNKSIEEVITYVECMLLTSEVSAELLSGLSEDNFSQINNYINAKKTATWFSDSANRAASRQVITSELIYYWMTVFHIDWEAQHWHLNRLFTLIQIANLKGEKPKKMSRAEQAARRRELNAQRQAEFGTKG